MRKDSNFEAAFVQPPEECVEGERDADQRLREWLSGGLYKEK